MIWWTRVNGEVLCLQPCIERMLNLTDHLRRLRVDRYEYVAMKVIVLLQSGKMIYLLFPFLLFLTLTRCASLYFLFRHNGITWTGKSARMSGESFTKLAGIYVGKLSGYSFQIRRITVTHSRSSENLSGDYELLDPSFTNIPWLSCLVRKYVHLVFIFLPSPNTLLNF